jgi:ADP-dependent phosphofructokinase/glucokinase
MNIKLDSLQIIQIKETIKDNKCFFGLIKLYRSDLKEYARLGRKDEILEKIDTLTSEIEKNLKMIAYINMCARESHRLFN